MKYQGQEAFKGIVYGVWEWMQPNTTRGEQPVVVPGRITKGRTLVFSGDHIDESHGEDIFGLAKKLVARPDKEATLRDIQDSVRTGLQYVTADYWPASDTVLFYPEAAALYALKQVITMYDSEDNHGLAQFAANFPLDLTEAFVRWEFGNTRYNVEFRENRHVMGGRLDGAEIGEAKRELGIDKLETLVASMAASRMLVMHWRDGKGNDGQVLSALRKEVACRTPRGFIEYGKVIADEAYERQKPVSEVLAHIQKIS